MPRKKYTKFVWGPNGELRYATSGYRVTNSEGRTYTVGKINRITGEWTNQKTVYLNGRKIGVVGSPSNARTRRRVEEAMTSRRKREYPDEKLLWRPTVRAKGKRSKLERSLQLEEDRRRRDEILKGIDEGSPRWIEENGQKKLVWDPTPNAKREKFYYKYVRYPNVAKADLLESWRDAWTVDMQHPGRRVIQNIAKEREMASRLIFKPTTQGEFNLDPAVFGKGVKMMALYIAERDSETYRKIQRMDNQKLAALYAENGKMIFEVYFEYGGISQTKQAAKGGERTAENARYLVSEYEKRYGVL